MITKVLTVFADLVMALCSVQHVYSALKVRY